MDLTLLLNPDSEEDDHQKQHTQVDDRRQRAEDDDHRQHAEDNNRRQRAADDECRQRAEDNRRQRACRQRAEDNERRQRAEESQTILRVFTCPRCHRLLHEPVTLACGNSYCRACLISNASYDMSGMQFSCPSDITCQRSPHVLNDLKSDVILLKAVDLCEKELGTFHTSTLPGTIWTTGPSDTDGYDSNYVGGGKGRGGRQFQFINTFANEQWESGNEEYSDESGEDTESGESDEDLMAIELRIPVTVPSTEHVNALKESLRREFECQICTEILIDPITTPCGHTYCMTCIARTLDHHNQCPLCRHQLSYQFVQHHLRNKAINNLIETFWPRLQQDRRTALEAELHNHVQDTAMYVGQLTFPNMPCFVDVREAQHRLMLRRCLESRQRQFGMILSDPSSANGHCQYGTMLEIRSTEFLADGRSLVETVGSYRFRVVEGWLRDGYHMGRIERIDDIDPDEEAELERQAVVRAQHNNADPNNPRMEEHTIAELITEAQEFIESLRNSSAPWLLPRLNSTYGEMPDDPSSFSFWVATVIPIDEHQKYRLLPLRSVRARLTLIVEWISQLREQWWISRGCTIS